MSFERILVDGVAITACRTDDVEGLLTDALAPNREPSHFATVNLDFLRLRRNDDELAKILGHCRHNFADGWPLLQLAALAGTPLPERVTGADLTPLICQWAGDHGWRLAFVGGSDTTRDILSRKLPEQYGPVVVGHWTPDYRTKPLRDGDTCQAIRDAGADIILVALGCPRQEQWIRKNLEDTGAKVAMGVGGSLDFMAGIQRRASPLAQKLHLEWLHRALGQPRRLGMRYLRDGWYYLRILRQANARQRHRSPR